MLAKELKGSSFFNCLFGVNVSPGKEMTSREWDKGRYGWSCFFPLVANCRQVGRLLILMLLCNEICVMIGPWDETRFSLFLR